MKRTKITIETKERGTPTGIDRKTVILIEEEDNASNISYASTESQSDQYPWPGYPYTPAPNKAQQLFVTINKNTNMPSITI